MTTECSRRGFLGTTAGAVSAATLAGMAGAAIAAAQTPDAQAPPQEPPKKPQGMRVGMLTAPFWDEPLETVLDFAKSAGIPCLEVVSDPGSKQIDPATLDTARAEAIKQMLADRGLEISALAYFGNATEPGKTEEFQTHAKKCIDAAVMLGVSVVCMQTGMAAPNMTKINTIKKVVPKVYEPIVPYAKEKGVKIAIENWFETCLQGIDCFECLFEKIPDENFGLNYDPSHLVHQQCNHLLPIRMFPNRIFHTHAKDTLIDAEERARVGVYARGWWRYVVPGFGGINWGEYVNHLRIAGYEGVLSIEHEDSALSREKGFILGARHLDQFC